MNHQTSPQNDQFSISLDLDLSPQKPAELESRRSLPKNLGSYVRDFLGGFCERTMVASLLRKKCAFLLSFFLCSGLALEMRMTMRVIPYLFIGLYVCLGHQIAEDILRYLHLKKTNSASQKNSCLFEITEKTVVILCIAVLNLQYLRVVGKGFMLLLPLLCLSETALYWKTSKSQNFVTRFFYISQSLLIAAKMNNLVDFDWKTSLGPVWIYFGINAVYAVLAGLLFISIGLSSVVNLDGQHLSQLKSEAVGYIWHISYNAFNVVGIVLLIGFFGDAEDILEASLLGARKLNLFLMIYTAVLFPLLKKQTSDLFQDLLTILQVHVASDAVAVIKKSRLVKTEDKSKREFFLMISPTYFSLLKGGAMKEKNQNETPSEAVSLSISAAVDDEAQQQDKMETSQENLLCYICETNESNAIIAGCGHGGVCCDCVVKSVERKNECMGCRKPVKAIYKIESEVSRNGAEIVVEASEFAQILLEA